MRRFLELPIFIAACLAAVVTAGCGGEGDRGTSAPATPQPVEVCEASDENCIERGTAEVATIQAGREPAATPDPRVREIFFEDDVVKALIGDGEERQDFWLIVDQITNGAHGDKGGMVTVALAEPVSFSGEVPTRSDPCKGHGEEGNVDQDDPCLEEPREYGTEHLEFTDVRVVHAGVDTGRGEVVEVFPDDSSPDIVADMIEWAEENHY